MIDEENEYYKEIECSQKQVYIKDVFRDFFPKYDFNQLMRDRANILFELDAQYGLLNEVGRREDNTIDVSPAAFKQILAAKNINKKYIDNSQGMLEVKLIMTLYGKI